jgi:hypothetical protein
MSELKKIVKISERNKEELDKLKEELQVSSLDSVITDLLTTAKAYKIIQARENKISRLKKSKKQSE